MIYWRGIANLRPVADRLNLQSTAKAFCARSCDCGVWGIRTGRRCPTTLLDDRSPIPRRRHLLELDQFCCCVSLMLEFLNADRRQNANDRSLSSLLRHPLGRAAECPSEVGEPDY